MNRSRRWVRVSVGATLIAFAVQFAAGFPWQQTFRALVEARWILLALAAGVTLLEVFVKAWAWHLLLYPSAPHRFKSAQVATFIGAAVNCVAVSIGGEAARVRVLAERDGLGYGVITASVVASRILEGVALALFVGIFAALLPSDPWTDRIRVAAFSLLALSLVAWRFRWLHAMAPKLPILLRQWLAPLVASLSMSALAVPLLLDLGSWLADWASYHLSIVATGISVTPAVSFTALLVCNLGGSLRLTPGNVGVLQATLILALLPFGVTLPRALAAGLTLQAVQSLPILAIGAGLATGFVRATARRC